jgi:hypothetical protein
MKKRNGAMDRNAGMKPNVTSRPRPVRDTPIGGQGGAARPSVTDAAAARVAGVTKGRPMKETDRHPVVGKGKATRKA